MFTYTEQWRLIKKKKITDMLLFKGQKSFKHAGDQNKIQNSSKSTDNFITVTILRRFLSVKLNRWNDGWLRRTAGLRMI